MTNNLEIINSTEKSCNSNKYSLLQVFFAFLTGVLLCVVIFMAYQVIEYNFRNFDKEYLAGGWAIPGETESNAPHSLTFYDDYVDVCYEPQKTIRCGYKVERNSVNSIVTIFNCNGKDLTFKYSPQSLIRVYGDIEAIYYYAG